MWRLNSQFRASIFRDSTLFADDNICHEQPVPKITDDQASTAVAHCGNSVNDEHNYCYTDTLKMMSINVCGLSSKLLCDDFVDYCCDRDLCFFQETKTDSIDEPSINDIFGAKNCRVVFQHRKQWAKYRSGGVAFMYNCKLKSKIRICSQNTNYLWFILDLKNNFKILFGVIYIPPQESKFYDRNWSQHLEHDLVLLNANNVYHVCLVGDFNARTSNTVDFIDVEDSFVGMPNDNVELVGFNGALELLDIPRFRISQDNVINESGKRLIDICRSHGLFIVNGRCGSDRLFGLNTCKNKSVVDYFIMHPSVMSMVNCFDVLPFDAVFSDCHSILQCDLKLSLDLKGSGTADACIEESENLYKPIWAANTNEFSVQLHGLSCDKYLNLLDTNTIDSVLETFCSDLHHIHQSCNMVKTVGKLHKSSNRMSKRWYTSECKNRRKA